jgi:hypothetical protein
MGMPLGRLVLRQKQKLTAPGLPMWSPTIKP